VTREFGLSLAELDGRRFDLVIGAVPHDRYRAMDSAALEALVAPGGTLADLKGMWRAIELDPAIDRWSL
jgi:UDP-N-acetyl-D-galactosamine dehydrogenase